MRAEGLLLILLVGSIQGTEVRSHSELRGSGGLLGAFGRMAEWMLLKEVYGQDKAQTLVREMQDCSFDFSTPLSTILRSLQESCLLGLPTVQLFQQVFTSFFSLYQTCPQLSADLVQQLEVSPESWRALSERVMARLGPGEGSVDVGTQVKDVLTALNKGTKTFREIESTGSVDFSTMEDFLEALTQVRRDLVLDLVLALDSATTLLVSLTEETCQVLSFTPSH